MHRTPCPRRPSAPASRSRPAVEALEPRLAPATFTVTSPLVSNVAFAVVGGQLDLGGVGAGTSGDLRWCLSQANRTAGADTILFDLPAKSTIALSQVLVIYDDVVVRGDTAVNLTVSGNNAVRPFFVVQGTVGITGLTIADGLAQGGAGSS